MNVLDGLLFNLQTIAKVSQGKKLSTAKEFIRVDEGSWFQGWRRGTLGDGREKTINTVSKEIRFTIALSRALMESRYLYGPQITSEKKDLDCDVAIEEKTYNQRAEKIQELKKIREVLTNVGCGVSNICLTYENDADVDGHMQPLILEINECVEQLTKLLIILGEHL